MCSISRPQLLCLPCLAEMEVSGKSHAFIPYQRYLCTSQIVPSEIVPSEPLFRLPSTMGVDFP